MQLSQRQLDRITRLIAAFDRIDSAFDRGLHQLAAGLATISRSSQAAERGELPFDQLGSALALGKQQLAISRWMLALEPEEWQLQNYLETEQRQVAQVIAQLADRLTNRAEIRRLREQFAEAQPMSWAAVADGLDGAHKCRLGVAALRSRAPIDAALRGLFDEAALDLRIAHLHLESSGESLGTRFDGYLDANTRMLAALRTALAALAPS